MQVQEQVVNNDGHDYRGVTSTTRTTSDPVTGAATQLSSTWAWSGRPLAARIVGLAAGIVFIFLGFDFIFRATGAADVGFGAFVYSSGGPWPPPSRASSRPPPPPRGRWSSGRTSWPPSSMPLPL